MQKLLAIDMKAQKEHGLRQELFDDYLKAGWKVVSVIAAGAGADYHRSFLVVAVIEK